jgi:hypothetical protein
MREDTGRPFLGVGNRDRILPPFSSFGKIERTVGLSIMGALCRIPSRMVMGVVRPFVSPGFVFIRENVSKVEA